MDLNFAAAVVEAAGLDGIEMEVRPDYSGRGMYGSMTAAVVCGSWQDFAAAVALTVEERNGVFEVEDLVEHIRRLRQDSMGRDSIVIY